MFFLRRYNEYKIIMWHVTLTGYPLAFIARVVWTSSEKILRSRLPSFRKMENLKNSFLRKANMPWFSQEGHCYSFVDSPPSLLYHSPFTMKVCESSFPSCSFLIVLLGTTTSVHATQCGKWYSSDCLADDDVRYDEDYTNNLVDLNPIWGNAAGYWKVKFLVSTYFEEEEDRRDFWRLLIPLYSWFVSLPDIDASTQDLREPSLVPPIPAPYIQSSAYFAREGKHQSSCDYQKLCWSLTNALCSHFVLFSCFCSILQRIL